MDEAFSRTALLLGPEAVGRLSASTVAVFGVGGVGSYAVEALARAGLGGFILVDGAALGPSNINRQIIATRSSMGRPKVEVMRERVLDINPSARVEVRRERVEGGEAGRFLRPGLAYVVDAVDTLTAKLDIVLAAKELGIPVVSAMGAGNKLDPTRVEVADIYETEVCPLARVMRRELKRLGVERLTVVYSKEKPLAVGASGLPCRFEGSCDAAREVACETGKASPCERRRPVPGSVSFVPSAFGLAAASMVVRGIAARGK
jgi:tRNA A37 threonylcarbamoyladenosine dehydratase